MNEISVVSLLETATEAAERGADILVAKHKDVFGENATGSLHVDTKSSPTDFVTEADGNSQRAIIDVIQSRFPSHRYIAEEEGADDLGDSDSPYEWIIDPLDGTTNFIHGKMNFGTIIAVQKNGELLAGVIWMPLLNLLYQCAKGEGVTVNGTKASLRQTASMSDAVLSTNIMRRAVQGENGAWYCSMPYCGSVENYGNAAQEMGEIVLGQNDGAFFKGIRLWDVAAGCLMVEEMGGKYRYEHLQPGNNRSGLLCVASTEKIFDELCDFVFEKKLT